MLDDIMDTVDQQYGPARMIELGKIKIGGLGEARKSKGGKDWRLPRKDDHFTITTLSRNLHGDLDIDDSLMAELIRQYGDKDGMLRQIPIRLLDDDIDQVLQARFVWYGNKSAGAVSDGKTVTWFFDKTTFQPLNPPLVEPWTPEMLKLQVQDRPLFKLHANFRCVIAANESRWGGVYLFRTTSIISFRQLYASLVHIAQLTGGTLMGMPLMLVVRPMRVTPDGKPTNVYVVHVELRGHDLQQVQNIALDQAKFRLQFSEQIQRTNIAYRKLLVAPGEEHGEDFSAIREEFDPPVAGGDPFDTRLNVLRQAFLEAQADELDGVDVNLAFQAFVTATTGREFDASQLREWKTEDLAACEERLYRGNEEEQP
jgi:hypothetical protein